METDTAPRAPLEIFSEWQRCLAANDQQGAAKVVDAYTEVCLGPTDRTTGYGVAAANVYATWSAPGAT